MSQGPLYAPDKGEVLMKRLVIILALVLAACSRPESPPGTSEATASGEDPIRSCVEKGVAYFKEIESFPTLSDGRDAAEVALERCSRTTGAFDGLEG